MREPCVPDASREQITEKHCTTDDTTTNSSNTQISAGEEANVYSYDNAA